MTDSHQIIRPLLESHLRQLETEGAVLQVTCDGLPATLQLDSSIGWSLRLVLIFDTPHPEFGDRFQTKHFGCEGPGCIGWGREGGTFRICFAETKSGESWE